VNIYLVIVLNDLPPNSTLKPEIVRICPVRIYGSSTGRAPIHVSSITVEAYLEPSNSTLAPELIVPLARTYHCTQNINCLLRN